MTVNTLGSNEQDRSSRTVAEWLWPFLPMGISAFSLSALIWYHLRRDVFERDIHSALQVMYANLYKLIGFAPSVLFFLLTLTWSSIWFATGKVDRPLGRLGRLLAMTVMIGILINLGHGGVAPEVHKGELGAWLAEHLYNSFGYLPSLLVVWAVTFASMLLATDFFFSDSFERLRTARPAAPTEVGVETAVTDHLRGLGAAPVPLVVPTLPSAAERPAPAVGTDLLAAAAVAEDAVATPTGRETGAGQQPIDEPPPEPRRRSYAERRRDRERRWEQEEWVPPAPENQEIENPEASLRTAGLTEVVAIVDGAPDQATTVDATTVDTAELVTQASAAAPATVGETPALDGETDLVDIEELEDFVDGEEEEPVADDDDDDDADEVDADATDGDREDLAAPVEIERPIVVAAVEAPTPAAEPTAVAPVEAGVDAFARDGERAASDDRGATVDVDEEEEDDAEELDDANPDGARDEDDDDVRQFDEIEDVDEVEDALEVVAEAGAGDAGRPQPAPGDEPVVSIPRPDPSIGWSPVFWQPQQQPEQPAAPAAESPVEIPSREPEPVERREALREAEAPSARETTDERVAGRQQQLFGSWLDEGLIQDAIEVVTSTRRANAALLQRKLRIDYALAVDVLGALAARGVVELEGDSTQGRVLV